MAVEIKEMIVRAVIEQGPGSQETAMGSSSSSMGDEELVAKCVKEVLKIIKAQKER